MAYLLVWRIPCYPSSDDRCRRIVEVRTTLTLSQEEADHFNIVNKPDVTAEQIKQYHAVNANNPVGSLLTLHPSDAPKKSVERIIDGRTTVVLESWTQQEIDSGA
jgi:hypothetical protein